MADLMAVFPAPLAYAPGAVAGAGGLRKMPLPLFTRMATGRSVSGAPYVGSYSVSGTVTIAQVPKSRKVRLYFLHNGHLVAEMWSDPVTGAYAFAGLELAEYYVWSEDYAREYDPVSHLVPLQG